MSTAFNGITRENMMGAMAFIAFVMVLLWIVTESTLLLAIAMLLAVKVGVWWLRREQQRARNRQRQTWRIPA
jgi:uncharacterized membrane protein YpjA